MPAAERGHKALGRAAAARHGSQLLAVLGLCTVAMLEACRGGVSQARATLVTAGLAYAVQVRLHDCTCLAYGSYISVDLEFNLVAGCWDGNHGTCYHALKHIW